MPLQGLVDLLRQSRGFSAVARAVQEGSYLVTGLSGTQRSALLSTMYDSSRVMFVVTHGQGQADRLAQDLEELLPSAPVYVWEGNELMPYDEAEAAWDLRAQRLEVLTHIQSPGAIIVAPVQGLVEGLVELDPQLKSELLVNLSTQIEVEELAEQLVTLGYERTAMVETFGQFSIRGGIVDIAPFNQDNPIRIEFFDDEVDSIRTFELGTQKSLENIEEVAIVPAREVVYCWDQFPRIKEAVWEAAKAQSQKLYGLRRRAEADRLLEQVARHLEAFEEQRYFPGMNQYKPFLGRIINLLDLLPENALVVLDEPTRVRDGARDLVLDIGQQLAALLEQGRILPETSKIYQDWHDLWASLQRFSVLHLAVLGKRTPGMDGVPATSLGLRLPEHMNGSLDRFLQKAKQLRKDSYRMLVVTGHQERADRLVELLRGEDIPAFFSPEVDHNLQMGSCLVTTGSLETGFEFPAFKLAVYTDLELYGKRRAKRHKTAKVEKGLRLTQADLKEGDYVVHVNHGIGQYLGVETMEVGGHKKDYLKIRYAGQDRLYLPTDQINLLQRYVGLDDQPPRLSKLGGNEWARVKKRAKESVKELAGGLLQLYAEREAIKGFAYPPDSPWQNDFESLFPYEETPDQLTAISEVKQDMQKQRPMDRLLCGDVGYGKTEVAIRAAFKAVSNGKQVAVLVPTTILAQQHHRTFKERFESYPVNVAVMSRFQSPGEISKILAGLKSGSVDVVIGTHRLLSPDVVFKDLGLVVVDEEQRFGVAQKERLKEMCKHVDVLTLSATPIPRTLHMAMVGVRDMSIIETPPEDRYPIRTYVVEYDEQIIQQAIRRELARSGQVYFVYNRVQSIDRMYSELQELVPEARIAIGHGQMDETVLERTMLDFYNGEFDILLCTTIIETGMDIPNVNTLIVYDADHLGLAQLYQLRGRVGRTNRVAYAYFTHRKDKILSEDAEKRLQAIKEFTELGSGIKIAMRDLEIRGAGNILGPEQHGFITSVGFEMYCRLLEESIRELKGEVEQTPPEPVMDLEVDAYIPDEYVPDPKQKVELYQRIIELGSLEDCGDLEEEIQDRFGDLPTPVRNLLQVARAKILARFVGVSSISVQRGFFLLKLLEGLSLDHGVYAALVRKYRGQVAYRQARIPRLRIAKAKSDEQSMAQLVEVLQDIHNGLTPPAVAGRNE
ncbi:MAG TPA: transcription-repair coupling factor [Firmicutes bacterium]|nr:transcription-repair coupling factor [Bacillota bacterium]